MIGIKTSDEFWEIIEELHTDLPDNQIAHCLYNHEVKRDTIDYLSLTKQGDEVLLSYLPTKRVKEAKLTGVNLYAAPGRQTARIGKALNKILIYDYDNDHLKTFVEQVQKYFMQNTYELIVVPPSEFKKYYLVDNYVPAINSELGKSCMRYAKCQDWMGIYEDNPNLEMVVALRRGKVAARGLIWKKVKVVPREDFADGYFYEETSNSLALTQLKSPDNLTVMDRIYACNPTAKEFVAEWAKTNCDLIHQTPKNANHFKTSDGKYNYGLLVLSQDFDKYKYRYYPYVDTFKIFDIAGLRLLNSTAISFKKGGIHFNDAQGGTFGRLTANTIHYSDIIAELDRDPEATPDLAKEFAAKLRRRYVAQFED